MSISIPPLPLSTPFVDKNGMLTIAWQGALVQLQQQLAQTLSNEGVVIPQQPTANIITLNTAKSTSAILYDENLDEFKGCVAGVFKTFTLT